MFKLRNVGIFTFFLIFFGVGKVSASCSVSVSPNNVVMGQSSVTNFSVSNTGEAMGNWVRIQSPGLAAYTIANMQATGWYPNGGGTVANFAGGYLEGGTSSEFNLTLAETGEVITSMSWEALLSYDGGENFESCGSTTLQVIPAPAAPTISGVSLTVGNSSATLNFNSDLTATGIVNFGTTSGYGSSVTSGVGTSHAATLGGLTASTLYHYQIQVTSEGGTTSSADATFTTSAASVTTTTTTVVTNTVTTTNTTVNTISKIISDTTPPSLKIDQLKKRVYPSAPVITGSAIDDRGIAKVEYRIKEREESWSKASLEQEVGEKKTTWEFLPPLTMDSTYQVEVRAVDVFGNISAVKNTEFVIDQLPPTVSGGSISYGALPLFATDHKVQIIASLSYEIVVYERGGADRLAIDIGKKEIELAKVGNLGLWRGVIQFEEAGEWVSIVRAKDGAGNETEREWVRFEVVNPGKIRGSDGKEIESVIEIYSLDPTTKSYQLWDGQEYGIGSQRQVSLVLPKGSYYLMTKIDGRQVRSQKIELANTTSIFSDWQVQNEARGVVPMILKMIGYWPRAEIAIVNHGNSTLPKLEMIRSKWIGEKTVVYFGQSILPFDSVARIKARDLAKRNNARYIEYEIGGQDDAELASTQSLKIGLLPQVFLMSDKGDTVEFVEGIFER